MRPAFRRLLAAVLLCGVGALLVTPARAHAAPTDEQPTPRRIAAPARPPLAERLVARYCPQPAPTTAAGRPRIRRIAVSAQDPAAAFRRSCSRVRGLVEERIPEPPSPLSSCVQTCPATLRKAVREARERVAASPQPLAPWRGGATACTQPDPTGGSGCVTGATRHAVAALQAAFGPLANGPVVRSAGCWDAHAWNPSSDHPKGRACDFFPGQAGSAGTDDEVAAGWRVARFFRENAGTLAVSYVIWQGRFWSPATGDQGGWGEPYTGGGIYDVSDVTGGHFDHIHVSFSQ